MVPDIGGLSPLVNGLLIHPPSDPTPGDMPADPSGSPPNTATITFTVIVNPAVPDGTVLSNQGFVSAPASGIVDQPSDDPGTTTPNDPTRDIVGNVPLLYATKTAALSNDLVTPGIVDPGDTLRYTITVLNSGTIAATGAVLTDSLPANTTYVPNSTTLNGTPVPDGATPPPLASGVSINSPGAGAGTIAPGDSAVLQFDLVVNIGTLAGTLIVNQAVVDTVELPTFLTDGDGNPGNGAQPTVVVVGAGQQMAITKQVMVVGGGPAQAGSTLEYVVTATNVALVPALNVVLTDTLPPGQLAYVAGSATMNGLVAGVSVAGSTITADYAGTYGPLAPSGVVVLRFRATLDPGLADGTVVTNTGVVAWSNPTQTASASVSVVVGSIPGLAALSGSAWHDTNFDNVRDVGEGALAGWTVELYRNGSLWNTVLTDANGDYRFNAVDPNDTTGVQYEIRFRALGAGPNTASLGRADSPFTNGLQRISAIIVASGANQQGLNLPIDPNGVVYNSMARVPVPGATLTLLNAGTGLPLPASCFGDPGDNGAQQGQITLADGWYKFDVNFSDPACPIRGSYLIAVTPPLGAYVAGYSQIIPPTSGPSTPAYLVPSCPGGIRVTVGAVSFCEVQPSEVAPPVSVPPASVIYRVHLLLDSSPVDSSQIYNNHIPLDPQLNGALAISKTTPLLNVTRGQMVPYVITMNNLSGTLITGVNLVDRIPAGFAYVAGSARIDDVPTEPSIAGLDLTWIGLDFTGTQVHTVKLLLAVGAGVTEAEYVNRAQVLNGATGLAITGEATATVRVMPDPTLDCTDVTGKVFNDVNRNGRQDEGEEGLSGVRLVTPRG
ncbi:MAG TPA: SdrD B-like domain-containing protein, partial [Acidimicrobiales bacterium]|nr:SdrD B-like domain-containing protein [Acidimicrobiales bacterium]